MNVDLNNTFKYDKIVLNLNSSNCLPENANITKYYINFPEPLKNIIYIKILDASILSNSSMITTLSYNKYDPIYIGINDYDRSRSYIRRTHVTTSNYWVNDDFLGLVMLGLDTSNVVFDQKNYFATIPYSSYDFSEKSYNQASFDWTDPSVYILNPPEQNLRRFNIELRDKNFNLFNTNVLSDFNLSVCAYLIKNRI